MGKIQEVLSNARTRKLLSYIMKNPGSYFSEIVTATGISRKEGLLLLLDLEEEGILYSSLELRSPHQMERKYHLKNEYLRYKKILTTG